MAHGEWKIMEIGLVDGSLQLRVLTSDHLHPLPGQYFLAFAAGMDEALATPLYYAGTDSGNWFLAGKIPPAWQPGTRLVWRGPLGHGFHLPPTARRVALAAWNDLVTSLSALVNLALTQDASVVWYSRHLPEQLPPSVEVLPLESLPEAWDWADYLALECDSIDLPRLAASLLLPSGGKPDCTTEILLHTPLTCGGTAECGVCAVRTKKGWKLACKDGPVYEFDSLELAA